MFCWISRDFASRIPMALCSRKGTEITSFTTQIGENAPVQNQVAGPIPPCAARCDLEKAWCPRPPTKSCEDHLKKPQELQGDQGIHRFVRRLGRRCEGRKATGARICPATAGSLPSSGSPPPAPSVLRLATVCYLMPPNAFSNHLARWVYKHSWSAVVYLELRPDPNRVLNRWNSVHPISEVGAAARAIAEKRKKESANTYSCTGFFRGHINPRPQWPFRVDLCSRVASCLQCKHVHNTRAGFSVVSTLASLWPSRGAILGTQGPIQRNMTRGEVYSINCENDLMLLRFPVAQMATFCLHDHRPLSVASKFPTSLKGTMLISWRGVGRRWATAIGTSSQQHRQIDDLGEDNSFGFTTRLSEVDITSESGSSGAPLLNGDGHVLGVLHGGNKAFSYFVGLRELRETATAWGIIVH